MPSSTRKTKHWSFFQRARYLIIFFVIPKFIWLYFRFVVNDSDLGNSYVEGQPVIFCSNHQSNLDALIAGAAVAEPYGTRRFIAFMGNGYAMKENWLFSLTPWCGGFPVYRDKPTPALRHAVKTLKEGKAMFISPQGKRIGRSPVDDYFNLRKDPRSGVGRIILWMNGEVPVVPLYIHGAGAALSRGHFLPRYKSFISVSFGKPIFFEDFKKEGGWKEEDPNFFTNAKLIAARIMDSIHKQMLIQEENLLTIVEKKYNTSIQDITEDLRSERDFRRYLRNLCNYSPQDLE
ncbi:MAG: lysophospholipid acyltransferase family protein [Candidatus Hodarchaeales archaeon]|jgi:1-acyl-sn-glycerol-3-phosphate acyltransferase